MDDRSFVDLHTHTLFSDGELLPSELVRRAMEMGCRGLAITDHVDSSNLEFVVSRMCQFVEELGGEWNVDVIPGVELTHVPPRKIGSLAEKARDLGARWVVVHGETVVEPVAPGTNRAAIEARVDLLAHPGLISREEASMAARTGVFLEVTTRKGHSITNGWVVQRAREAEALLVVDTDTHGPGDILDGHQRRIVALGAGLDEAEVRAIWENGCRILERLRGEPWRRS
jgi:putative hydrolase